MAEKQTKLDGVGGDVTFLGFGGQRIDGHLEIGDELYVLMKCEVVSDSRSQKAGDDGELKYTAGAKTTILARLTSGQATTIAAQYGGNQP